MSSKEFSIELRRAALSLSVATDLWYLANVPTTLPSKTYRAYQLIGTQFKVYDEMFVCSFYVLWVKLSLAWWRK